MRQKRETPKDFQIQEPYGSIRGAKTYWPNQVRYSKNTESHSDLQQLTQYEKTYQANLQVPDISSPGYPVDVPPMTYILFVFTAAYLSFYFIFIIIFCAVSVMFCCSHTGKRDIIPFTNSCRLQLKMSSGKGGGAACNRSRTCKPFARKHYVETGTRPLYGQEAPRQLLEEFCYSKDDSVAVASGNSAATTMILWLWHQLIQQQPQ